MLDRLKSWAKALKRDTLAMWLAARDPRVPLAVKVLAGAVAAYALSPIDLIPDFIPVLGLLDDVLIVPAGIWLVLKLIPAPVIADLRAQAAAMSRPRSNAGLVAVLAIWLIIAAAAIRWYKAGG